MGLLFIMLLFIGFCSVAGLMVGVFTGDDHGLEMNDLMKIFIIGAGVIFVVVVFIPTIFLLLI